MMVESVFGHSTGHVGGHEPHRVWPRSCIAAEASLVRSAERPPRTTSSIHDAARAAPENGPTGASSVLHVGVRSRGLALHAKPHSAPAGSRLPRAGEGASARR